MMRIWFNRGFSLAAISQAIIAAEPDLEVYVSVGPDMPKRSGPTETWEEPTGSKEEYVDWVRERIVAYNIDILIPTRHRKALSAADLPCKVVLPGSLETLALLEDKFAFAEALHTAAYYLATETISSTDHLARSLATFPEIFGPEAVPCVKPRQGVNGMGFWTLTRTNPASHIQNPDEREMRSDLFINALREKEREEAIGDLVLMEFLPGPEISFDVLAYEGRVLKYAARTKLPTGQQRIQTEHPLGHYVHDLIGRFHLHGVVNAQFRRHGDGSWKILEINTRPAGGVVYAETIGAEILADWARLITGKISPEQISRKSIDTHIEMISTAQEILV